MPNNLLIVESPAKAKTIERYLGKDFSVRSSYGHIRDLEHKDMGVDMENGFTPRYVITPDKKKVVKELKDWVKKSDEVWLATDEDREGEAISWHLCEVLGLDKSSTKRIVFREITKPAIQKAIENPRTVDINLVNAQQARRVLDRLVGFRLSEVLWRKIKGKLSAGRVQSVAVRLIVEREREIQSFESTAYFRITAEFSPVGEPDKTFKAELPARFDNMGEARAFLEACVGADFTVGDVKTSPVRRKPSAPFITSTLQQEASRKLGFSVKRTMSTAQKLYERGHITYMRTDSTNLSSSAINSIAEEIVKNYGERYAHKRQYTKKKAMAQEAHEAIRPTYIDRHEIQGDADQERLYDLIWKRTIASQMADAELERTKAAILISTLPGQQMEAKGEVLKFDGFLKVYMESQDDDTAEDDSGILPPLTKGQELTLLHMDGTERFTRSPARYTEASLVKKLEELGIGRPSTYAPTISKIMEEGRGYVTKESRPGEERGYRVMHLEDGSITEEEQTEITGAQSNRLFASDMGMLVTDFLTEHFSGIMDYSFTAEVEKQFDVIAAGDLEWSKMISEFYDPFSDTVDDTLESAGRARGRRILGTDEKTGHSILAQMTRYGPVVQIGTKEEVGEDGKPQFANLRRGQSLETITLEEALKLFELPKTLGSYKDEEVMVGVGRYGPYVKYAGAFISLPRGEDPNAFTLEQAIGLIRQKEKENMPIGEYQGKPITKGKGRYGPFLKWDDLYVNVPRKYDLESISLEDAHALIAAKIEKEENRYIQKWDDEKIAIENGRWGPFIRKARKSISLPKVKGNKISSEQAKLLSLDEVKKIISGEMPESVVKKIAAESD